MTEENTMTESLTTREVADHLGTDPKTLRRFLRDPKSTYMAAGQGGRYTFTKKELPSLKKRFAVFAKAQAAAKAQRDTKKAATPAPSTKSVSSLLPGS